MKFWIPVVSKWQPKQYKTLADVPEGIACVVVLDGELCLRVRQQDRGYSLSTQGIPYLGCDSASNYNFIRTLDPLPESKVSIADLPDGRCFKLDSDESLPEIVYWKRGDYVVNQDATGRCGLCPAAKFVSQHPHTILDIEMQLQDFPETQSN